MLRGTPGFRKHPNLSPLRAKVRRYRARRDAISGIVLLLFGSMRYGCGPGPPWPGFTIHNNMGFSPVSSRMMYHPLGQILSTRKCDPQQWAPGMCAGGMPSRSIDFSKIPLSSRSENLSSQRRGVIRCASGQYQTGLFDGTHRKSKSCGSPEKQQAGPLISMAHIIRHTI